MKNLLLFCKPKLPTIMPKNLKDQLLHASIYTNYIRYTFLSNHNIHTSVAFVWSLELKNNGYKNFYVI